MEAGRETLPPVATGPSTTTPKPSARVQVMTTPANIPFRVLGSAYETATPDVRFTGTTPATVDGLNPGAHRIIFAPVGGSVRSMMMQIPDQGTAIFHQEFPHGDLQVTSQPAGATVICDGRQVGVTPMKLPLSVGKHRVTARWKKREARMHAITTADGADQKLAFDFRPAATTAKKKSKVPEEPEPLLTRVNRSVMKFLSNSAEFIVTGKTGQ